MFYLSLAESPSLDPLGILIGGLGGLGLFLYGMHKMSDGLQSVAGDSMKTLLTRLTKNRFVAAITGAITTAVLQSSSITTILVIGFVGAGLMTLPQTVGIIMGANVGTTITAQMLAFNLTELAWLLVALGFGSWSFGRKDVTRNLGTMLMGFGMLFIGMGQMSEATSPLQDYPPFIDMMAQMDKVYLAVLVGAAFTALVQSSSATIGIVIMLATQGQISLEAGISLGIGAKVGTCVTALLAGLGKPAEARRVGVVHVLHNLIGALLWLPFIDQLAMIATSVSPAHPELEGTARLAEEVPRQVANAITIYASANLAVLIWFTGPIARLATLLVKDAPENDKKDSQERVARYLDRVFLKTPALAIDQIRREVIHLGDLVQEMLEKVPAAVTKGTAEHLDEIQNMGIKVDRLHAEILEYISVLLREEINLEDSRGIDQKLEIANNLEAIADLIEINLVTLGRRRLQNQIQFSDTGQEAVESLYHEVDKGIEDVFEALSEEKIELAIEVNDRKERVESMASEANDKLARKHFLAESGRIEQFRIESDIVDQLSRLFYRVRSIAKSIASD